MRQLLTQHISKHVGGTYRVTFSDAQGIVHKQALVQAQSAADALLAVQTRWSIVDHILASQQLRAERV